MRDQRADQPIPTATSGAMRSAITSKWHLIAHEKLGDQIYEWTGDPGESNNLINTQSVEVAEPSAQTLAFGLERQLCPQLKSSRSAGAKMPPAVVTGFPNAAECVGSVWSGTNALKYPE